MEAYSAAQEIYQTERAAEASSVQAAIFQVPFD